MRVYWRKVKRGQNLILSDENDAHEEELGEFRDTQRGIDALAKTFSYDPSRSRKGFPTIEESNVWWSPSDLGSFTAPRALPLTPR